MMRNFKSLRGYTLAATDGEIGTVREMLFDEVSWTIRYLVVDTGSWLFERTVLIAPRALGEIDDIHWNIGVHLTQEQVRNSPPIESEKPVSRQYEEVYYSYYSWDPYWTMPGVATGLAVAPSLPLMSGTETQDASKVDRHLRSSDVVLDYSIHAEDGEFGHVADYVIEDDIWCIRYLVVDTRKWLPGKHVLVAPAWIQRISYDDQEVFVNLRRTSILNSPEYNEDEPISPDYEQKLHDHYGYRSYREALRKVSG